MRTAVISLGALLVSLLVSVAGCVTDPVTGEQHFSVVRWTPAEELELGREAAPNIESQFDARYLDRTADEYLTKTVREMVSLSVRRKDFDFRFKILNSSVPNAFALPGGFVYITRGLLELMESEGQFISVMGHELGHVEHQHAMYNASRGTLVGVVTSPLRVARAVTQGLPGSGVVGVATGVAELPLGVWGLKYSRAQELEADERGVYFSAEMGYDPSEGIKTFETFERLARQSDSRRVKVDWFDSHPLNPARIQNIEKIISERYPALKQKPKDQFRTGGAEFASVLKKFKDEAPLYKTYDEAIANVTSPTVTPAEFEKAEAQLKEIAAKLPNEPLFHIALGEAAIIREKPDEGAVHFTVAIALYDQNFPDDSHWKAHLYLGIIAVKAKEADKAVEQLTKATRRFPLLPEGHYFLGMAYELKGSRSMAAMSYKQAMDLSPPDSPIHQQARDRWRVME